MVAVIIFIALICVIIWGAWADRKRDKENEEENRAWLEEESKRTAKITFVLCTGEELSSPTYITDSVAGIYGWRRSARGMASMTLDAFYAKGRFIDDKGNTYPACNVARATVIEMTKETHGTNTR